ncbi:MAG: GGDEF domain-containing protein [Ruminiclostridium sp.]|nr:GGDEF domain-containing protein [Ruminiclostridium sp.]
MNLKETINKLFLYEGNSVRYKISYGSGFIAHLFYAIVFGSVGITFLMIFNIFSTVMYLSGLIFIKNNKYSYIWLLLLNCEVISHGVLCTYYLGFDYQFSLFSFSLIPITFFISYLDPSIKKPIILSSVLAFINAVSLWTMLFLVRYGEPMVYSFSNTFETYITFINMFFAILLILVFSIIFTNKINIDFKKLRAQNDTLDYLANYDQLTGLCNRSLIYRKFGQYIEESDPFCVILGDIDDFKHVNDTFGHFAGDDVLKNISSIIKEGVGDTGEVCRWGGEEILLLIKGSVESGLERISKILDVIRNTEIDSGDSRIKVTMTFGLCGYKDAASIETLISLADKRLYMGKSNGKNRIVTEG